MEITESAVMDNAELAMRTLSEFKALGVHLAIDDFGTGYSSLSYLKRFPVDVLKIDKAFIEELGTSQENSVIVGVTIRLAHALGMRVVAEGVETDLQLRRLSSTAIWRKGFTSPGHSPRHRSSSSSRFSTSRVFA